MKFSYFLEILDALNRNDPHMTCICLSQIGDEGAKYIAEALTKNSTLTHLYLSYNQIGDKGAKYIAGALAKNSTLTHLDLGSNQIGDEGAKHIEKILSKNRRS